MPLRTAPAREEAPRRPWPLLFAGLTATVLLLGTLGYLTWTLQPVRVGHYTLIGPMWGSPAGRRRNFIRWQQGASLAQILTYGPSAPPPAAKCLLNTRAWSLYEKRRYVLAIKEAVQR